MKRRVRRDFNPHYNDPDFSKQWFLVSIVILVDEGNTSALTYEYAMVN